MNKLTLNQIIVYILSILILFSIPFYSIATSIITLKNGNEYLFKIEALDPYDIYKGNYLNISFKEKTIQGNSIDYQSNNINKYYVTIGVNSEGFAYFKNISITKPKNTSNYFKTTGYYNAYKNNFFVDTPTIYYMHENKTITAEQIYRNNIDNAYVKVKLRNGKMFIVGVYVNNILIDSID